MANTIEQLDRDSRWGSAAGLDLNQDELKLHPLELPRLISFIPNGIPRGSLIEITGVKSSGKTSISLYILAESISRGETCALIDLNNQFSPDSLVQTGITLDRLSWVLCHRNTEHAIRSADLFLHAGGFGLVLLDLNGASPHELNKIPLSYWFRFRRAVENTPTILLICSEYLQARSCSRHSLEIKGTMFHWAGERSTSLLKAIESTATPRKAQYAKVTSIRPEPLLIPAGEA